MAATALGGRSDVIDTYRSQYDASSLDTLSEDCATIAHLNLGRKPSLTCGIVYLLENCVYMGRLRSRTFPKRARRGAAALGVHASPKRVGRRSMP